MTWSKDRSAFSRRDDQFCRHMQRPAEKHWHKTMSCLLCFQRPLSFDPSAPLFFLDPYLLELHFTFYFMRRITHTGICAGIVFPNQLTSTLTETLLLLHAQEARRAGRHALRERERTLFFSRSIPLPQWSIRFIHPNALEGKA